MNNKQKERKTGKRDKDRERITTLRKEEGNNGVINDKSKIRDMTEKKQSNKNKRNKKQKKLMEGL